MKSPLDMGFPQQFLIALTIVTVGMLVVATGTSTSAFGSHNSGWDGASELRSKASDTGAKVDLVRDTSSYTSVNQKETVAVILSPKEPYSPTDKSRVKAFVRDGGTVVVAEDFGSYSNGLLGAIGASTRVDGRLIRDKRQYYQSPALPIVRTTSSDSYLGANERLTFNYGTALRPNGATVLAKTSKYSYFDSNNNQTLDSNETLGSRPVATTERIGDGRVIVVSDPSLFVNAMLDRSGNEAFVRRDIQWAQKRSTRLLASKRTAIARGCHPHPQIITTPAGTRWHHRNNRFSALDATANVLEAIVVFSSHIL